MTKILGVNVDFEISKDQLLNRVSEYVKKDTYSLISTTNAEFIMDAQEDPEFMNILNEATLSIPDGAGLLYANEYLNRVKKLKKGTFFMLKAFLEGLKLGFSRNEFNEKRLVGRELIYDLCDFAQQNNYSVFLLGGWEKDKWGRPKKDSGDISGKAARRLSELYPSLNIVGYASDFRRSEEDDVKTIEFIQSKMVESGFKQIDILFVAYNHKWQEKWIKRNADKIPARVCLGIGGTLDYLAGSYMTTSPLFTKLNLEWLYKLLLQPWRIGRIIKVFPLFPLKVFLKVLKTH